MPIRLLPTGDGWFEWRQDPRLPVEVFVRLRPGDAGRVHLSELRVVGQLTSEVLRTIPVGRIEAAANAQVAQDGWDLPAGRARRPRARPAPTIHLPADEGLAQAGRGRPDAFYAMVADAYRYLAQVSHRPAADLAKANDVPPTTAHRWIREARRRGMLAPGHPGKAG